MVDFTLTQDKKDLVVSELRKVPGAKVGVDTAMIRCPFHSDRTPSCSVYYKHTNKDPGRYFCFSCGAKGEWNSLATVLGLQLYDPRPKTEFVNFSNLKSQLKQEQQKVDSLVKDKLELYPLPLNKKWRTIPTNLLIDIGCKLCRLVYPNGNKSSYFVYLPVKVDGALRGYTKGRLKKEPGATSYINAKGSWVKEWGLFPFDYAMKVMEDKCKQRTVVLVEGQRDALRLLQKGIPALCIQGTNNWTDKKRWLLEVHGVERVVVMMDGDDAGIKATNHIYPTLTGTFDFVNAVKLWKIKGSPYLQVNTCKEPSKEAKKLGLDLWDPGNCPDHILDVLKQRYID